MTPPVPELIHARAASASVRVLPLPARWPRHSPALAEPLSCSDPARSFLLGERRQIRPRYAAWSIVMPVTRKYPKFFAALESPVRGWRLRIMDIRDS